MSDTAETAWASNPIPIVVPCHRVLRSGGGLGGYTSGIERKEYLLALVGRMLVSCRGRLRIQPEPGEVVEWLEALAASEYREQPRSRVRIPLSPPAAEPDSRRVEVPDGPSRVRLVKTIWEQDGYGSRSTTLIPLLLTNSTPHRLRRNTCWGCRRPTRMSSERQSSA